MTWFALCMQVHTSSTIKYAVRISELIDFTIKCLAYNVNDLSFGGYRDEKWMKLSDLWNFKQVLLCFNQEYLYGVSSLFDSCKVLHIFEGDMPAWFKFDDTLTDA